MVFCACVVVLAAYPPLYPDFPISAMDTPLKYHEQELSYAGIDLPALIKSGKKVTHNCRVSSRDSQTLEQHATAGTSLHPNVLAPLCLPYPALCTTL